MSRDTLRQGWRGQFSTLLTNYCTYYHTSIVPKTCISSKTLQPILASITPYREGLRYWMHP